MSRLPRATSISNVRQLNMEMKNRPDLMKQFKHKPYSQDQSNEFKKVFEKELKK